jgi:hypothetical protein
LERAAAGLEGETGKFVGKKSRNSLKRGGGGAEQDGSENERKQKKVEESYKWEWTP